MCLGSVYIFPVNSGVHPMFVHESNRWKNLWIALPKFFSIPGFWEVRVGAGGWSFFLGYVAVPSEAGMELLLQVRTWVVVCWIGYNSRVVRKLDGNGFSTLTAVKIPDAASALPLCVQAASDTTHALTLKIGSGGRPGFWRRLISKSKAMKYSYIHLSCFEAIHRNHKKPSYSLNLKTRSMQLVIETETLIFTQPYAH